jgi:hypothetical protein
VALFLVPLPIRAQEASSAASESVPETVVRRLGNAFSGGDAQSLLENAADRVEVSLFGARTYYSRSQALLVMRDFFEKYGPRKFESAEVAETGNSYFVTGRYWHVRAESPLRVYIRVSRTDAASPPTWRLHEIRIERKRL